MKPVYNAILIACLFITACKSPFNRTKDASSGPTGSVGTSGQFTIFSDELQSGGGAFEYPGSNNVSLVFDDHSNPISKRSIRYSWNGQPADGINLSPTVPAIFAGFSLMHVPVFTSYVSTPGRDLRAAGYTHVVFSVRGDLSTATSVKIEAGGPTSTCITLSASGTVDECGASGEGHLTGTLTSGWHTHSLMLTSAQQSAVKDFFKATFIFENPLPASTNPGQGGTIYLDQIFYKV